MQTLLKRFQGGMTALKVAPVLVVASLVLAACGASTDVTQEPLAELDNTSAQDELVTSESNSPATPSPGAEPTAAVATPTVSPEADEIVITRANFRQLLYRDDIRPIYEPTLISPNESGLGDDELVMGVSIEGESRAYPIRVLRFREIVDDELGGLPILVTW